jgi:hypothetical protein
MGQLNDYRSLHHIRGGGAWPEVGAEDDKQRPEAFPASCDDVLRGFGHQVRVRFGGLEQGGLDELELIPDRGLEHLVSRLFSQHSSSVFLCSRVG